MKFNPVSLLGWIALVVLLIGVYQGVAWLRRTSPAPAQTPAKKVEVPLDPFVDRLWVEEARKTLHQFLTAETPEDRIPLVLAPASVADKIVQDPIDQPEPLSAELFTALPLTEGMRKDGLFALYYERPGYSGLHYLLRPMVTREVEIAYQAPSIWDQFAKLTANQNIPLRGRVTAFFRRDGDRLLLDWETFIQTRDRVLFEFAQSRHVGAITVRVTVRKAHPEVAANLAKARDLAGGDWFWIEDPSFPGIRHALHLPVGSSSELLNHSWDAEDIYSAPQAATISIAWHPDKDAFILNDWVCWNYLHLPGAIRAR